ncbi:caspase family protein [Nostoc flagelliforme FACHB-838]|uniref:Caspase family protein n=1 Tax=Nostoc flagelliforme FACHB-838 TaxID=2692904 RepID=A0ABR8DFN6_9NOSO|nr:caspase family protein [Nostoc flagelliforme]MBD2528352.1 caspase family protein [Nostoc flagelliforme FACHB-838]
MTKVALLIGVSDYEPGLNPLPASVRDMEAIAKVLQHPEMGAFAEADIQKLENPDPQKMQEAIETLFSDRRKEDLILLYFSGHGIKDESGKLYLATRLTRKNSQGRLVKATAVPANFIHNIMSDSRSKRQVVILDCCFSGAFAEGLSAKDDGSVDIHTQLGGEGRVILTSSTSTQYSFQQEGDNLSIYTRYVVEGIETGAADQDNDGVISIDELHEYAKKKVREAAPAMQPEIYAVKEGFKIRLAKAPIGDPKLRYRKEVELFASRGVISAIGRNTLDLKRQSLGLLPEEATIIETEVLKPYEEYQKRLRRYEQVLIAEIKKKYPLSDETRNELKSFQEALGLRNQDLEPILVRVAPKEVKKFVSNQSYIRNSKWAIATIVTGILLFAGFASWKWSIGYQETQPLLTTLNSQDDGSQTTIKPESTQTKTTEPKPTQTKTTEPKPTQTKTTEPKPTQTKTTEPKPTQTETTEPKPTQTETTEPKPPTPVIQQQDCLPYNPTNLQIVNEGVSGWLLTDGRSRMLILDNEADAKNALALAQRHTAHCFLGRNNTRPNRRSYIVNYWTGNSGINTTIQQPDCLSYNPANLKIVNEGDSGWLLTDGRSRMAILDNEADAKDTLVLGQQNTAQCFIGRNNTRSNRRSYIVNYWQKKGKILRNIRNFVLIKL